jgi:hypothetical protein
MAKTALFFGSEHVPGDSIALDIFNELKGKVGGVAMARCSSPMEILYYLGKNELYIVDAVRGLNDVSLFKNLKEFRKTESATAHDLDLGTFLQVLGETDKLKKIRIIGIPPDYGKRRAASKVKKLLSP